MLVAENNVEIIILFKVNLRNLTAIIVYKKV